MNNFNMSDTRRRRNLLNWTGIFSYQPVTNYSTDSSKMKMDIKNSIGENLFLNNLHLIRDPLKKNLADSIITGEVKTKTNMASETKTFNEPKMKGITSEDHRTDFSPPLGGITNFLSGVINFVSSAMFLKRTDSPTQYYECFEQNFDEMAPSLQTWHLAKPEVQNKNGRAHNVIISTNEPTKVECSNMNSNCRTAAAQCENKLNQMHLFLQNQHLQYQSQLHPHSPKYLEQSSIEDCYEDAFSCEDFETLSDQSYLEYFGPFSNQDPEILVSDAPRIKTEYLPLADNMEITPILPDMMTENAIITNNILDDRATDGGNDHEPQIVETCEEKMNKLKTLLQEKFKKKSKNEINSLSENLESIKNNEQHTQPIMIPNSNSSKIMKNCEQEYNKENDVFWNKSLDEEDVAGLKSIDDVDSSKSCPEYLDPSNYFNEVTGKFCSTSVDSDDSFQIVFTDSPKSGRGRIPSECESEDSFIVFEDSPDSCYSSKDVFGDEIYVRGLNEVDSSSDCDSDSDEECDDSDSESDSGCDAFHQTCKLSHSLTRTIGDLTDDSLYNIDEDEDEVDCAALFPLEKPIKNTPDVKQNGNNTEVNIKNTGLLIDEKRKLEKKKLPKKSVRFSEKPPKVHVMRVWAFAARQARAGHWERHALDRERFKRRIADVEMAVSWVLKPQHRSRVMFQRFMPWWNAQKRKELAEIEQKTKEEKEVKDAATNGTYDAGLHSANDNETDRTEDKVEIENNFEKYNGGEKELNGNESKQMNERPDCNYEKEIDEKSTEKTNTPKLIRKNGKIIMNGQIAVVDNNKNVLKFGFEDNIIDST